MMHAIILFSHGSVLCGAGENLFALARQMEDRGAAKITIAPYFLVAGYFVGVALPPKIEAMRARFPDVEVVTAQALKTHELLAQAVLNCASRAQKPEKWRDILDDAPRFCIDNPACPLNGTPKCPLRPSPR